MAGTAPPGWDTASAPPPGWDSAPASAVPPPGWDSGHPAGWHPPAPVQKAAAVAEKGVKAVKATDVGLKAAWDAVGRHPPTSAFDVLSSAQRAVSGAVTGYQHHDDLGGTLKEIGNEVFGVFGGNDQHAQAVRDHVAKTLHYLPDDKIKGWVNGLPSYLNFAKPAISGLAIGAEDATTDPMTYAGGVVFKGAGNLMRVAATYEKAHDVAKALGIGNQFQHLEPIYKHSEAIANKIGSSQVGSFFRARPELDDFSLGATTIRGQKVTKATGGFTPTGKKIRQQLENKVQTQAANDRFIDEGLTTPAQREARVIQYINQYGDSTKRAQLAAMGHPVTGTTNAYLSKASGISDVGKFLGKFRTMSDEEQAEALKSIRNDARDGSLARKTESAVRLWDVGPNGKPGNILKPGSVISDYRAVPSQSRAAAAISDFAQENVIAHGMRDILRTSIFLNPLPHGIKNVGQLAYLAGGFPAVMRGMKSMLTGDIDRDRLSKIGALPEYTQHQLEESFWAKVPGFGPAWVGFAGKMQGAMQHMEEGWRQGLLETLDKKLGPSKDLKDELLKGATLQSHLGDYANQSALVQSFSALGGPFAAFRAGIVPKNVVRAIAQDPQRILLALRAKYNLEQQRPNKGKNTLETGGPMDDFFNMAADPLKFMLSPSTLGAIGSAASQEQYGQRDTAGQAVARQIQQVNPLGEFGEIFNAIVNGARPNEKEGVADKLTDATLLTFGMYFKRLQAMKQVNAQEKGVRTQANKAYKPVEDFLHGLIEQDAKDGTPGGG